jgi:hypothetical protein
MRLASAVIACVAIGACGPESFRPGQDAGAGARGGSAGQTAGAGGSGGDDANPGAAGGPVGSAGSVGSAGASAGASGSAGATAGAGAAGASGSAGAGGRAGTSGAAGSGAAGAAGSGAAGAAAGAGVAGSGAAGAAAGASGAAGAAGAPVVVDAGVDTGPVVPTGPVIKINAGGPAVGTFVADKDFTGGTTVTHANTIDLSGVTDPAPEAVYQSAHNGNFSYTIPGYTAGTSHTVRLHFCETYFPATTAMVGTGQRVCNVSINGAAVLTAYDIFAKAGGKNIAVVEESTRAADSGGNYVIAFSPTKDQCIVSGIEIQ